MTWAYAVPLSESDLAFRHEVQAFIAERLRPEWRGVSELWSRTDMDALAGWTREMVARGWAIPDWPTEYGGTPLSVMQRYIISRETARVRAPLIPHVNLHMVGPLIIRHGSPWQQEYFLPRILHADDYWSQGFSEPGAGSDLASLRTTARRDGTDYIVNGQKIWTTSAHLASELLCLVRTDPDAARRQDGISIMLVSLATPGVTVRPIRSIDGVHHLNEVFFEDARVPASRLLGEENRGWQYAREMLAWERESIADVNPTKVIFEDVVAVARERGRTHDPLFRQRLLEAEFDLDALEMMELCTLLAADHGEEAGYKPSLLKILGSSMRQQVLELARESLGALGAVMPGAAVPQPSSGLGAHFVTDALLYRAATIYGGTNEIQRDMVASIVFAGSTTATAAVGWLTEEQRQLRKVLHDVLAGEGPDADLAELGIRGATIAEGYGGSGAGASTALVIAGALGEARSTTRYVEDVVLLGTLIAELGTDEQRARWLPRIADGTLRTALALIDSGDDILRPSAVASREDGGFRLMGTKAPVPGAPDADVLLVSVSCADGVSLHVLDPQEVVRSEGYAMIDGRAAATVVLDGAVVDEGTLLGPAGGAGATLARAVELALAAQAAEVTGIMAHLIRATTVYLGERVQFGRPLATFQVLRHRVADMVLCHAQAEALVTKLRVEADAPGSTISTRSAVAAAFVAARAARRVGEDAVQLHGGMGMTEELGIGPALKRIYALETRFGSVEQHAHRFGTEVHA